MTYQEANMWLEEIVEEEIKVEEFLEALRLDCKADDLSNLHLALTQYSDVLTPFPTEWFYYNCCVRNVLTIRGLGMDCRIYKVRRFRGSRRYIITL